MSFTGTGDGDWVEQDLDGFDTAARDAVENALLDNLAVITRLLGPDFVAEFPGGGLVLLSAGGVLRYRGTLTVANRLLLSAQPRPEGPL